MKINRSTLRTILALLKWASWKFIKLAALIFIVYFSFITGQETACHITLKRSPTARLSKQYCEQDGMSVFIKSKLFEQPIYNVTLDRPVY